MHMRQGSQVEKLREGAVAPNGDLEHCRKWSCLQGDHRGLGELGGSGDLREEWCCAAGGGGHKQEAEKS